MLRSIEDPDAERGGGLGALDGLGYINVPMMCWFKKGFGDCLGL